MKKLALLLVLISLTAFAQKEVAVDLSSPNATVYTHLYFLQKDSYDPAKAAATVYGLDEKKAEKTVIKIKKILDNKGLRVIMGKIPTNPNYKDTISDLKSTHSYILFPNKIPEIYVEKIGDSWYYSQVTVAAIDDIYRDVFPWGTEMLKKCNS